MGLLRSKSRGCLLLNLFRDRNRRLPALRLLVFPDRRRPALRPFLFRDRNRRRKRHRHRRQESLLYSRHNHQIVFFGFKQAVDFLLRGKSNHAAAAGSGRLIPSQRHFLAGVLIQHPNLRQSISGGTVCHGPISALRLHSCGNHSKNKAQAEQHRYVPFIHFQPPSYGSVSAPY